MNRVAQFLRSISPAEPFQAFFLAGLVCLTIAPNLRWWPSYLAPEIQNHVQWIPSQTGHAANVWRAFVTLAGMGMMLASSSGYFLCFWPGRRATLKILALVTLPSIASLSTVVLGDAYLRAPFKSVLSSRMAHGSATGWTITDTWYIGIGLHVAIVGFLLTSLFFARLALRESQLPLSLPATESSADLQEPGWAGCRRLIWFSVAACAVMAWRAPRLLVVEVTKSSPFWESHPFLANLLLTAVVSGTVLAVTVWLMGAENWKLVRESMYFTSLKPLLVGVLVPIVVTVAVSAVSYLSARAQWAAHDFGQFSPPRFASYFVLPPLSVLFGVFGVLVEEVTFRGVLQRHFVSRYGLWRGLFLVGIAWSAFHFPGDHYASGSEIQVLIGLSHRLAQCLSLGFVLGWLTIRSGSLWPAVVTHWLSNVGFYAMEQPTRVWWRTAGWLVVACVLFRFWPPERTEASESALSTAEPEIAGL